MLEIWKDALDSLDEGCPATLVMVVDHTGSVRDTTGATMVVSELGCAGTVGGGAVENEMTTRAGLHTWGLPSRGYKKKNGGESRAAIWMGLAHRAPWLDVTAEQSDLIVARDDALDAFVAALIARAAKIGLTLPPSERERERAMTEG